MWRVLKPGGLAGIRAIDLRAVIHTPPNPLLDRYLELTERVWRHNGGNPRIGGSLKTLLREAGFVRCEAMASFEFVGKPESVQRRVRRELARIKDSDTFQAAMELGWVDNTTLARMATAWQEFGQDPDAFLATAMCEAIGWKE